MGHQFVDRRWRTVLVGGLAVVASLGAPCVQSNLNVTEGQRSNEGFVEVETNSVMPPRVPGASAREQSVNQCIRSKKTTYTAVSKLDDAMMLGL